MLNPALSSGQEARLQARLQGHAVHVSFELPSPRNEEVLASLWEGLKSVIVFQMRLYRENRGAFSFLGDRLLAEKEVIQLAYFDIYENRYKILRNGEPLGAYAEEMEFLRAFFSLPDWPLGELDSSDPAGHYALARVRLMPVKIISPLNIITLFSTETVFASTWIRTEVRLSQPAAPGRS